jgi:hypothetical protein
MRARHVFTTVVLVSCAAFACSLALDPPLAKSVDAGGTDDAQVTRVPDAGDAGDAGESPADGGDAAVARQCTSDSECKVDNGCLEVQTCDVDAGRCVYNACPATTACTERTCDKLGGKCGEPKTLKYQLRSFTIPLDDAVFGSRACKILSRCAAYVHPFFVMSRPGSAGAPPGIYAYPLIDLLAADPVPIPLKATDFPDNPVNLVASDTQFLALSDSFRSDGANNLNVGWFAADQNPYGASLRGESAVVRLVDDGLPEKFVYPAFPEALPASDGSFLIVPSYSSNAAHAQARITLPLAKGNMVRFTLPAGSLTNGRHAVPEALLGDRLLYQFGANAVTTPLQVDRFAGSINAIIDPPTPTLPSGLRTAHAQGVFARAPGGLVMWLVPNVDLTNNGSNNVSLTQVREARLFWVTEAETDNPTLSTSVPLRSYLTDAGGLPARDGSAEIASPFVERATSALVSVDNDRSLVVLRGLDGGAEVNVYSRDAGMLPAYRSMLPTPLNAAPLNTPSNLAALTNNASAWISKGRVVVAIEDAALKKIIVSVLEPTCAPL